jgi:hypothetical protein
MPPALIKLRKADITLSLDDVRFPPENRYCSTPLACPLSARKRHMHRNKQTKLVSLRSLLSPCNVTNNRPIGGDKSALYFGVGVCPTNVFLAT